MSEKMAMTLIESLTGIMITTVLCAFSYYTVKLMESDD
jgi:type II secretory pathway pseudopilin PulG